MDSIADDQVEESVDPGEIEGSLGQGFVLTAGDIEILRLVLEHRVLRREQVSALVGRHEKRLHRRLFKLNAHGYLTTIRLPQQKHIYGLGRAGVHALVEQGIASSELVDERLRTHELTELFLKHEMLIVDIHVMLNLASRQGAVRLASWREGRELYDSVIAVDHKGSNRLPIRPDAFFGLEDSRRPEGANRTHFALEADRSTTSQTRFQDKIRAYWSYIEQGLHEKKFGVRGFRILTVTLTDERAKNLCLLAAATLPERARKYFLFAPLDKFRQGSPDPISGAICHSARSAGSDQFYALVPAPNQLQKE